MVLVLERHFLEGRWWKYAVALSLFQIGCWLLLGFKLHPDFSVPVAFLTGGIVWGSWILFAFLPFALGRLGSHWMFWCGIVGFVLADLAYFASALFEPIRAVSTFLPFWSFVQLNVAFLALGLVIEFGRYVYRKVFNA